MNEQEITELAAILVNEHGHAALDVAEQRRDQHAHAPWSDAYRLWARIADATARVLRVTQSLRENA
jgi:hypothetical protein